MRNSKSRSNYVHALDEDNPRKSENHVGTNQGSKKEILQPAGDTPARYRCGRLGNAKGKKKLEPSDQPRNLLYEYTVLSKS